MTAYKSIRSANLAMTLFSWNIWMWRKHMFFRLDIRWSLSVCACAALILQLTEKWWHVLNIICGIWLYTKWELCVVGEQFIFLPSQACVFVYHSYFLSHCCCYCCYCPAIDGYAVVVCGRFFPLHHFEVWPFDFYHSMMTIFNGNINNQCANSMFFVRHNER